MAIQKFPDLTPAQLDALEGEAQEDVAVPEGFGSDDYELVEEPEEGELELPFDEADEIEDAPLPAHDENLAEVLEDAELEEIAGNVETWFTSDWNSNADWRRLFTEGLDLLGLKVEDVDQPFPGAANAVHPILIENVVKFQSKAYTELFPPNGPVRTKVIGMQTIERQQQAQRVKDYMNYQIMYQMPEYGPELDRMLFYLAFAGSAFKKTYYDQALGRPKSIFLRVDDFVVNYGATDLETAARYTHKYKISSNELKKLVAAGVFRDVEGLPSAATPTDDEVQSALDDVEGTSRSDYWQDNEHTILEMHVDLDLDGDLADEDGIARPYIVSVERDSGQVLSIRRNWKEDDEKKRKQVAFTHYVLIPGFGFLGYGYLHLIGGLAKMATASMRQLSDAATLVNLPAGFKSAMIRVVGGGKGFMPGEFKDVQTPLQNISQGFMTLPFKEPSPTLFNLLSFTVAAAQKFADSTDAVIADSTNYGPVGTTMALIEASGKMFSAIHKRLHFAQKHDLKLLADLNYTTMELTEYPYDVVGGARQVFKEDFDGRIDVMPVSDPNMASQSQKVAQTQAMMALAQQYPGEHDAKALLVELYTNMGVEQPERFLAKPAPEPPAMDPITENFTALKGQPISVKMWEDHDAHYKVHNAVIQDPIYAQSNAQGVQVLAAHNQNHMAYKYMVEMQKLVGELPQGEMPPEQLNQIAIMASQAADKLLQRDVAVAKAIEQGAGPTEIDVAMRGLDIQQEKHLMDFQAKMKDLELKSKDMTMEAVSEEKDRQMELLIARLQAAHGARIEALKARKDVVLSKEKARGNRGTKST